MVDDPLAAQAPYPAEALDPRGLRLRAAVAAGLAVLAFAAWLTLRLAPAPDDAALPLRGATDARAAPPAAPGR